MGRPGRQVELASVAWFPGPVESAFGALISLGSQIQLPSGVASSKNVGSRLSFAAVCAGRTGFEAQIYFSVDLIFHSRQVDMSSPLFLAASHRGRPHLVVFGWGHPVMVPSL